MIKRLAGEARTPRRAQIACACASNAVNSAASGASCGPRTSSVNFTSPEITLTAPGRLSMQPTVATSGESAAQVSVSTAVIHSAAATSASLRCPIGTRAGVARLAAESAVKPARAIDRRHHAQRQIGRLQTWALFDM